MNLFVGGTARVPFEAGEVKLRAETDYPWGGKVSLHIEGAVPVQFALHLRKPGWCDRAELSLNGSPTTARPDDSGYWTLDREWKTGDVLSLLLDLPVRRMIAHPNVAPCRDKVALQRGPLVYGFEGLDNDGDPRVTLSVDPKWRVEHRPDLLGGVTVIRGAAANGKPILAIPFYALANRGRSSQEVWVSQEELKSTDDWWRGALYRPLPEN